MALGELPHQSLNQHYRLRKILYEHVHKCSKTYKYQEHPFVIHSHLKTKRQHNDFQDADSKRKFADYAQEPRNTFPAVCALELLLCASDKLIRALGNRE
jgi:hypothetical protein